MSVGSGCEQSGNTPTLKFANLAYHPYPKRLDSQNPNPDSFHPYVSAWSCYLNRTSAHFRGATSCKATFWGFPCWVSGWFVENTAMISVDFRALDIKEPIGSSQNWWLGICRHASNMMTQGHGWWKRRLRGANPWNIKCNVAIKLG